MPFELFEVFQQGLINEAVQKADAAKRDSEHTNIRVQTELQRLNSKIDGLALICEALWELLSEYTQLTEDDIHKKIRKIDLRDGTRDGKITGKPTNCPGCGRPGHTRTYYCMYCGAELEHPNNKLQPSADSAG